jgi:hypothetical protein
MPTSFKAKAAALLFVSWGLMHVAGGGAILLGLADGTAEGYGVYKNTAGPFPEIAGAALGYLAYFLVGVGALVAAVGTTANWRNSPAGLALNTGLVLFVEAGLVYFLVLPGYVTWAEASVGLTIFALAALIGGRACHRTHGGAPRGRPHVPA